MKFDFAEKALVFYSTNAKGEEKAETLAYEEAYASPEDAVRAVSAEVRAHGGATRGALTLLVDMFQHATMSEYAGDGADPDTGKVSDWKIPKHVRDAFQATEEAFLLPMFGKDMKKARELLSQWRARGTYAVCKGQALRYFYFSGRLPCRYTEENTPDTKRLLPVSAMQRLLKNLAAEEPDRTLAGKVLRLHGEFDKREGATRQELQRLAYTLRAFLQDVDEAINIDIAREDVAELPPGARVMSEAEIDEMRELLDIAEAEKLHA